MIGILGGSGLYQMDGLVVREEIRLDTPFGAPSDPYVVGELAGRDVVFLPRHGRGHRLLPTELNYRANVWGFKKLGVDMLLSVGAVGSMQEAYAPTHIVVPDQFIDRTRHRPDTFFGNGLVAHVSLADPVCPRLVDHLVTAGRAVGATMHRGGTYLCMEGPQFSTRAESQLYRSWGVDVIGMTNLQEAKLAREAELCYATLAMITDYDCWRPHDAAVTADEILRVLGANARMGQEVVRQALSTLPAERTCGCGDALGMALVTAPELVPRQTLRDLAPIVGRYLPLPEDV
jgi:5'-methylthioadenosine phosphorylase